MIVDLFFRQIYLFEMNCFVYICRILLIFNYLLRFVESVQGEAVTPDYDPNDLMDAVEQQNDSVPAAVGVELVVQDAFPGMLHGRLPHFVRHSTAE
jgi:hypothetical protein